jgi:deoxyribonuclease V
MEALQLHPWDLTPREAATVQSELASRVVSEGDPPESRVRFVAGCDCAFDKPNRRAVAAVVVLAYPSLEVVEQIAVEAAVTFPYVPGLLSFRETPPLLQAFERLQQRPDLLMVDGHGYAHPRRFGYACHLGVLLEVPTVGVAKSRLVGEAGTVAGPRGSRADIIDAGDVIGGMLRTRQGVRSIFVSVGHRIGLKSAERWVLRCATKYRVPEPTRLADRLAGEAKRRMLAATLEIVIEQRAGERGRWEWVAADDNIVFRHELEPMPTHYGCSIDLINDADGELLDVMLVDNRQRERAERTSVRVVDVLERADGDHKLLAVPADEPEQRLDGVRERIWRWYVALGKPVTRWAGADAAVELIASCRRLAAATDQVEDGR